MEIVQIISLWSETHCDVCYSLTLIIHFLLCFVFYHVSDHRGRQEMFEVIFLLLFKAAQFPQELMAVSKVSWHRITVPQQECVKTKLIVPDNLHKHLVFHFQQINHYLILIDLFQDAAVV